MHANPNRLIDREPAGLLPVLTPGQAILISDDSDSLAGATGSVIGGIGTEFITIRLEGGAHDYFKAGKIYGIKAKYVKPV